MPARRAAVAVVWIVFSVAALGFLLVVFSGGAPARAASTAPPSGAPPAADAADATEVPGSGGGFRSGSANLARIWWNQSRAVELLGLSDEQRKAMDALLIEHLGHRRELAKESFEIRKTLGDHLATGDWKAAEKASADLGERASALARGDVDLTLAVVRLLRPEQRRTLDEELPMILRRPWLQGGVGMRPGRLGRQAAPRRSPGE